MPKIIKSIAFHNEILFGKPQRNYEHNSYCKDCAKQDKLNRFLHHFHPSRLLQNNHDNNHHRQDILYLLKHILRLA